MDKTEYLNFLKWYKENRGRYSSSQDEFMVEEFVKFKDSERSNEARTLELNEQTEDFCDCNANFEEYWSSKNNRYQCWVCDKPRKKIGCGPSMGH